jgi:hypothetical protein
MHRRYGIRTLLIASLCMTTIGPTMAQDTMLEQALRANPRLEHVFNNAEEYRLQAVLGMVEKDDDGRPVLRQKTYRTGAEYFYPASTVKLFAAVAAAQKLAMLRQETGHPIDLDTPLIYHPLFEDEVLEKDDPDNLDSGSITVRQQIREIFLVSDNQAYNYLYELVGQDGIAASLKAAGLDAPRIVHRLSEFRTPEEHRQLPEITFIGRDFKYTLPQRTSEPLPPHEPVDRIMVGRGYYADGVLIEAPMDFSTKNYFPLVDLQRGLCMLVRPDVDCGGPGFELSEADRELMKEAMSQYPRKSDNPRYDREEYPDHYVKDLLPGLERVIPKKRIKIYNKTGQAYGFSTENAWVVDTATGNNFFLAVTLYTNKDGILNDDEYEYDETTRPFMADLGEAVARVLWQIPRK